MKSKLQSFWGYGNEISLCHKSGSQFYIRMNIPNLSANLTTVLSDWTNINKRPMGL